MEAKAGNAPGGVQSPENGRAPARSVDRAEGGRYSRRRALAALALAGWGARAAAAPGRGRHDGQAPAATIAAASDLQFALPAIARAFREETGAALRLSFGSSGNFARQIEQGAPFELFLSADEAYVARLVARGIAADRGALYAIGRIALFVGHDSPLQPDAQLRDLRAALGDGRLRRFAIANPEHAPYGRAARAVLEHAGLWAAIEPKLVFGENVAQAAQFAASGSAQGGLVPWSLSHDTPMAALGRFARVDADWHAGEPLHQRMVLLRGAGQTARTFFAYLRGPAARAVLAAHGFELPAENG